jgi:putative transposase
MGRKSEFSEAQIVAAVREVEGGAKVGEVARKVGVSLQTMARWRARFSGMTVSEAKEKRRLEEENAKLKKLVAQFAMEIDTLKVCLGKKW